MTVRFYATYRDITGCKSIELPAQGDLRGLLSLLVARYGAAMAQKLFTADGNALGQDAVILVNGRHVAHLQGLDTPLTDIDVVAVFPLVAGG